MATEEFVLKSEYDKLVKDVKKLQRQIKKFIKQTKEESGEVKEKRLSGFAKPTLISKELADFLKVSYDDKISRTDVTKRINVYIKENNLQNVDNKRVILMDDTLKKLILVPDDVDLTFFNLQKYIKHHYIMDSVTKSVESKEIVIDTAEAKPQEDKPQEDKPVKKVRKKVVKK